MTALRNAVALAAALALLPICAEATVSRAISFDDKVTNAASIILGKCVRQESRWDDAQRWILTYSTFEVERAIKGLPARQITIVTPGGSVGSIHQDTIGVPKFTVGDEHIVFVRNTAVGPSVLYFDQGAYAVAREGSERIVKPVVSAAVLVDSQRGMAVAPESPRTLREFEASVRDTVRRKEAMRMEMVEREKREQASLVNVLRRNKMLVLLALAGAVLATWQLVKRW
jgi:hypothetical protein